MQDEAVVNCTDPKVSFQEYSAKKWKHYMRWRDQAQRPAIYIILDLPPKRECQQAAMEVL